MIDQSIVFLTKKNPLVKNPAFNPATRLQTISWSDVWQTRLTKKKNDLAFWLINQHDQLANWYFDQVNLLTKKRYSDITVIFFLS